MDIPGLGRGEKRARITEEEWLRTLDGELRVIQERTARLEKQITDAADCPCVQPGVQLPLSLYDTETDTRKVGEHPSGSFHRAEHRADALQREFISVYNLWLLGRHRDKAPRIAGDPFGTEDGDGPCENLDAELLMQRHGQSLFSERDLVLSAPWSVAETDSLRNAVYLAASRLREVVNLEEEMDLDWKTIEKLTWGEVVDDWIPRFTMEDWGSVADMVRAQSAARGADPPDRSPLECALMWHNRVTPTRSSIGRRGYGKGVKPEGETVHAMCEAGQKGKLPHQYLGAVRQEKATVPKAVLARLESTLSPASPDFLHHLVREEYPCSFNSFWDTQREIGSLAGSAIDTRAHFNRSEKTPKNVDESSDEEPIVVNKETELSAEEELRLLLALTACEYDGVQGVVSHRVAGYLHRRSAQFLEKKWKGMAKSTETHDLVKLINELKAEHGTDWTGIAAAVNMREEFYGMTPDDCRKLWKTSPGRLQKRKGRTVMRPAYHFNIPSDALSCDASTKLSKKEAALLKLVPLATPPERSFQVGSSIRGLPVIFDARRPLSRLAGLLAGKDVTEEGFTAAYQAAAEADEMAVVADPVMKKRLDSAAAHPLATLLATSVGAMLGSTLSSVQQLIPE